MSTPDPVLLPDAPSNRVSAWPNDVGWWAIILCYVVLTLPALLGVSKAGRDFDEASYHYPTILDIVQTWPKINMHAACFSAVAPGYHYLLATFGRFVGDDLHTLRWLNWAFGFLLPLYLYRDFRRRLPCGSACLLLLPLVASNFFIKSACWISPDNAGITAMALALTNLLRVRREHVSGWAPGLLATLATAFRQLNLWLVGPLVLHDACWFVNINRTSASRLSVWRRVSMLGLPLLCGMVMPLLVIAALYSAWGGLVPV